MRNSVIAFSVILAILAATNIQTSAEQICTCVSKGNGKMRFISDPGNCKFSEKVVCWEASATTPGSLHRKARKLALIMDRLGFIDDFPVGVLNYFACRGGDSASATFAVEGGSPAEVIGLMGDERISTPYAYYVAIRRGSAGGNPAAMIGRRGTVVYQRSGRTSFFVGVITEFGLAVRNRNASIYVAKLEPAFATLERSSGYAIYQDVNLPALIELILDSGGVAAPLFQLSGSYAPSDFEMMYDESPANFASRQMERKGVHYHFSQAASGETMIIGDTNASFTSSGLSLIYGGHFRDTIPGGDFIASFHLKSSLFTGTAAVAGYDFELPKTNIYAEENNAGGIGEKFEYAADITEGVAAATRASVNADREFRNSRQCSGISNAADLKAGHIFSLADRSGAGFSGRYLITQVRHLALWNQERSCFVYCNVFSAIPNNVTFRPKRKTPLPKVPGVVTAVVAGPAEETQYVDDYGRIKVQFRWDRQGSHDEKSSAWIRVLIPAGNLTDLFIPEIGSEVVVSFIQGNPSLPMVLGSVYNGDYLPPPP